MTATPFEPGPIARQRRPANVRATTSDAPPEYPALDAIPPAPSDVFDHVTLAAQYGKDRRGRAIRGIVLHTTEGGHPNPLTPRRTDYRNAITYNTWRPETVSSTAHVGPFGETAIEVPEHSRPWTNGRWNDETLTLEIIGRAHSGTEKHTDGTTTVHIWDATAWRTRTDQLTAIEDLIVDWCRRHDIPGDWLDADQWAEGASRAGEPLQPGTRRGITDHHTANKAAISLGHDPKKYSHSDIGPGLRAVIIDDVLPRVRHRLNPQETTMATRRHAIRLRDTRDDVGIVSLVAIHIPDIPAGYNAAIVNITITAATRPGYAVAWSGDGPPPDISNLPVLPLTTTANLTHVPVNAAGDIAIAIGPFQPGPPPGAAIIVDLIGYDTIV